MTLSLTTLRNVLLSLGWSLLMVPALAQSAAESRWRADFGGAATIDEAIRYVQQATGKTFLVEPGVAGEITVHASQQVSSDQLYRIFLSTLEVNGFTAVRSGNLIKIVSNKTVSNKTVSNKTVSNKEARSAPTPVR